MILNILSVSGTSPKKYIKEIEERIIYRLQQEFDGPDLAQDIVFENFNHIFKRLESYSQSTPPRELPSREEVFELSKKKKFYPDCNKSEAWAEGYFSGFKKAMKSQPTIKESDK